MSCSILGIACGTATSCKDILAHRDALWRFVDDPHVDPTNNHAERELRAFVLWRKGCYGSRSQRRDTFAANLKPVVLPLFMQRFAGWRRRLYRQQVNGYLGADR